MRRGPALVALLLLAAPAARAAELERIDLLSGVKILSLALEDLDGDGTVDPVVASSTGVGPEARERTLHVYKGSKNGTAARWELAAERSVPDDVIAWGLGDFSGAGERELIYFTSTSAYRFDRASGEVSRILGDHPFFFTMPSADTLPYWDPILDLNGDGRDDLILADRDGYVVYLQTPEHRLERRGRVEAGSEYMTAPRTERRRRYGSRWRLWTGRTLNRLCLADVNADGRIDLIAMKGKELLAYPQRGDGHFDEEPGLRHRLVAPGTVPFEQFTDETRPKIAFGDVNNDGRVDFVVPEIDLSDLATRLRIFISSETGLPEKPTQILKLSSLGDTPELYDINGDGHLDLGVAAVRTDLLLALANPTVQTIDFTYYGFLFRPEEGAFSRRPDIKWDTSIEIPDDPEELEELEDVDVELDGSGQGDPGLMRINADFNGDGAGDLTLLGIDGTLAIYTTTVAGIDSMSVKVATQPFAEAKVGLFPSLRAVDLDGDGRSDFALQYTDSVALLLTR